MKQSIEAQRFEQGKSTNNLIQAIAFTSYNAKDFDKKIRTFIYRY